MQNLVCFLLGIHAKYDGGGRTRSVESLLLSIRKAMQNAMEEEVHIPLAFFLLSMINPMHNAIEKGPHFITVLIASY
jgi:hypothetical protein